MPKTPTKTRKSHLLDRLVLHLEEERGNCLKGVATFRASGFHDTWLTFTHGQLDALTGVLHWIQGMQDDTLRHRRSTAKKRDGT
jgi:hypothetical protein